MVKNRIKMSGWDVGVFCSSREVDSRHRWPPFCCSAVWKEKQITSDQAAAHLHGHTLVASFNHMSFCPQFYC